MFQVSSAELAVMRKQAEESMRSTVTMDAVDVVTDLYGEQTIVTSGVGTFKAYIGAIQGREDEIVERLRAEGLLKLHTAKMLAPFDVELQTAYRVTVSGGHTWDIVWINEDTTDEYQLYSKAVITRNDAITEYVDRTKRNG